MVGRETRWGHVQMEGFPGGLGRQAWALNVAPPLTGRMCGLFIFPVLRFLIWKSGFWYTRIVVLKELAGVKCEQGISTVIAVILLLLRCRAQSQAPAHRER